MNIIAGILGALLSIFVFVAIAGAIIEALFKGGKAAYVWARDLGKDTIQILQEADPEGTQTGRLKMAVCLVRLAILVAMADGQVSQDEFYAILDFFRQRGADDKFLSFVTRIAKEVSGEREQYEKTVALVNEIAAGNKDVKLYLCAALLQVAIADKKLEKIEVAVIWDIMEKLGFSEPERTDFFDRTLGSAEKKDVKCRAFATLGLSQGASQQEIRDAFRRLAHQYHPDKVASLGPELIALAQEKFLQINNAYELLKEPEAA
jgi:DnaJ like chaperone protein